MCARSPLFSMCWKVKSLLDVFDKLFSLAKRWCVRKSVLASTARVMQKLNVLVLAVRRV